MSNKTVHRERIEEVERSVLDYLGQHADAMDSFEGIARFWIPRQRLHAELNLLETAITELVKADVLEALEIGSGQLFRLRSKRAESCEG